MSEDKKDIIPIDSLFWKIAIQDDEIAFKELFHQFFASLCVFSARMLGCNYTAEDIVQDVFMKIWRNRKDIEITTSTRNFLITSVRNATLDHLRRCQSKEKYMQQCADNLKASSHSTDLVDLYAVTELEEMIKSALSKLPENVRESFELNRFEMKTYAEIAEIKQISIKTVESHISKSLKILRVKLSDYLPFITLYL